MARTDTLPHFLTDVADAIREKTGSSGPITASNFDTEIENIPSGADLSEYFNCEPTSISSPNNWAVNNLIIKVADLVIPSNTTSLEYLLRDFPYSCKVICDNTITNFRYLYGYYSTPTLIDTSGLYATDIKDFYGMFSHCTNLIESDLSNLTLSYSSTINYGFMYTDCYNLKKVILPDVGTNIQSLPLTNTFSRCYSLTTLVLKRKQTIHTYNSTLQSCYHMNGTVNTTYNPQGLKDGRIYVPDDLVDSYKTATGWSAYADQILPLSEYVEE